MISDQEKKKREKELKRYNKGGQKGKHPMVKSFEKSQKMAKKVKKMGGS